MATSSPYGLFGTAFGGGTSTASNPNNPFNTYKPGSLGAQAASPAANVSAPSNTLPKGATALPTMAQTNSTFMNKNPQYSTGLMTPPNTNAASPQPALGGKTATNDQAANIVTQSQRTQATTPTTPTQPPMTAGGTVISPSSVAAANTPQALSAAGITPQYSGMPTNPNTQYAQPQTTGGVYNQSTQNLANTQTTPATTAAVGTSQGIATNQGASAPAGTPGAYANTATTGLLGQAAAPSQALSQAEQQYNTLAQQSPILQAELAGNPNIASEVASGRGQILANQLSGQLNAAQQNVTNALGAQGQQITAGTDAANAANSTQGQQLTGANQAGNLANTAQSNQIGAQYNAGSLTSPANTTAQVPYNNQLLNLQNGQPVGGGTAGQLPPDAQAAVNSYAQQVQNGSMTRADAESRLSAYGVAGTNALNSALGPNFNTNASNASAQTTATGQAIQTAATATNSALDTLGSLFGNLSSLQTGGIPLTDSIANWFASQLGQTGLTQYQTALSDARSQLIGVLNASGGTPTGNEATAMQYLPDNMTAGQFQQLVGTAQNPGTARQLVQQKVSAFTNSGTQNGNSSAGSSGATPMFGNFNG